MINHLTIATNNHDALAAFYEAALVPLGYVKAVEFPGTSMFADMRDHDGVWIAAPKQGVVPAPGHFAFVAENEEQVQTFYDAALAAGGTSNGEPGPRPDYGPNYYAAFVLDPDGNNIEAVFDK